MKCREHPGWDRDACVWCGAAPDSGPSVESDRNKFEREKLAQHVQPGVTGVRTAGQYQRLLKRHGLTDDIPTKEIIRMTRDTGKRERVKEEKIQGYLRQMAPQIERKAARLFRP